MGGRVCPSFFPRLQVQLQLQLQLVVGWRGAPLLPFWPSSLGVVWVVGPPPQQWQGEERESPPLPPLPLPLPPV